MALCRLWAEAELRQVTKTKECFDEKCAVMCNKPLTENTDRLGQCQGKAGRDYGWSDLDVFPLVLEPIDLKPIAMIMAYI